MGSMWRRNPIPACNCDSGKNCGVNKSIGGVYPAYFKSYAAEAQPQPVGNSQRCSTGTHFPVPCPKCYGQAEFGSAQSRNMWAIVDKVQVPNVTGEFVLRWRWDTEQVGTHCYSCRSILIISTHNFIARSAVCHARSSLAHHAASSTLGPMHMLGCT